MMKCAMACIWSVVARPHPGCSCLVSASVTKGIQGSATPPRGHMAILVSVSRSGVVGGFWQAWRQWASRSLVEVALLAVLRVVGFQFIIAKKIYSA